MNWEKAGHSYKIYAATDLIANGNYYGQGICHWKISFLESSLWGQTNPYQIQMKQPEMKSEKPFNIYLFKDNRRDTFNYPGANIASGFSEKEYRNLKPSIRKHSKFFYVTVRISQYISILC
jgi:hypothetical protein